VPPCPISVLILCCILAFSLPLLDDSSSRSRAVCSRQSRHRAECMRSPRRVAASYVLPRPISSLPIFFLSLPFSHLPHRSLLFSFIFRRRSGCSSRRRGITRRLLVFRRAAAQSSTSTVVGPISSIPLPPGGPPPWRRPPSHRGLWSGSRGPGRRTRRGAAIATIPPPILPSFSPFHDPLSPTSHASPRLIIRVLSLSSSRHFSLFFLDLFGVFLLPTPIFSLLSCFPSLIGRDFLSSLIRGEYTQSGLGFYFSGRLWPISLFGFWPATIVSLSVRPRLRGIRVRALESTRSLAPLVDSNLARFWTTTIAAGNPSGRTGRILSYAAIPPHYPPYPHALCIPWRSLFPELTISGHLSGHFPVELSCASNGLVGVLVAEKLIASWLVARARGSRRSRARRTARCTHSCSGLDAEVYSSNVAGRRSLQTLKPRR